MDHPHVGGGRPHVNGRAASAHGGRRNPGILKGLPSHFQDHALLGVERLGFLRAHPEEGRIKLPEIAHDAGAHRTGAARRLAGGMPIATKIESLFRHFGHDVEPPA